MRKLHNSLKIYDYFQFYHDRNLEIHDIPGAQPGSLQSKVVRNKEMAQKINEYNSFLYSLSF